MRGIPPRPGAECDRHGPLDLTPGVRPADGREDRGLYGGGGGQVHPTLCPHKGE